MSGAAALTALLNEQQRAAHGAVELRPDAEITQGRAAVAVARDHKRRARLCRIVPPREPQPVGRGDVHALVRQRVERINGAPDLLPVDLHLWVGRYVMVVVLCAAGRIKRIAVQPVQPAERGKRRGGRGAERLFSIASWSILPSCVLYHKSSAVQLTFSPALLLTTSRYCVIIVVQYSLRNNYNTKKE